MAGDMSEALTLARRLLARLDALLWYSTEAGRLLPILKAARDSEDPAQMDAALAEQERVDAEYREMWAKASSSHLGEME